MKVTPSIDKRECRSLTIGGITNYPPFTGPLTGLQALHSVCFPRIAFICLHHHSSYNVSQRTADSYGLGMPHTTPVSLPLSPKPPLSPLPHLPPFYPLIRRTQLAFINLTAILILTMRPTVSDL